MDSEAIKLLSQPSRERLADQISRQIKQLILTKKLQVGEKLPTERQLAQTLKVSKVVVREALHSLEQAGFVEIHPGPSGGSFVSDKSYRPLLNSMNDLLQDGNLTLQHFYEARKAIELTSMQLALENIREEDLKELENINDQIIEDIVNKERFPYHNREFHVKISEISGNPLIKLIAGALLTILIMLYPVPMVSPEFVEKTYHRHLAIINAMKQRNRKDCEELICQDVEMTKKMLAAWPVHQTTQPADMR
jgi:DNA-binding FadR family transcriptional regulator